MRKILYFTALLTLVLLSACGRQPSSEEAADLILIDGKILTVDDNFSIAQAIAVKGEHILAVGDNDDIRDLAGPDTLVTDLMGATVVPGLIDNHNHFVRATEQWFRQVRWDDVRARSEALEMLREKASQLGKDQWVVVLGGWIPEQFKDDPRPFTREELDRELPDNPVYIQQGYTRGFANSLALGKADVTAATTVDDGTIIKDDNGDPTGELDGTGAFMRVAQRITSPTLEQWHDSIRMTIDDYVRSGVTTLLDVGGNTVTPEHYYNLDLFAQEQQGRLGMRVFYTLNAQNAVGPTAEDIMAALEFYPTRSGDDYYGRFTYGEMTYEGIRDPNGAPWNPTQEDFDNYQRILEVAAKQGWQIHEHSTREDKMQAMLDIIERVNGQTSVVPLRWTIAHAETASDDTIRRARDLGMLFAIHSSTALGDVARAQNGENTGRIPPIRQINDSGAIWGLGSDGTVVSGYNPFHNLGWAVTGIARNGQKLLQSTVSREDALRAHTINNAYMLFMENKLGSLEAGKYADLVVLDRDYLNIPGQQIHDIRPVMTMVGGKIVYAAQ